MPVEYNGKIGITAVEAINLYGSWYNVEKQLQRGHIERLRPGGNGRILLIDLIVYLPKKRSAMADPRQIKHVFEKYYRVDNEARRFFTQYRFENGHYLRTELQDKYIVNASVLRAIFGFSDDLLKERKKRGIKATGLDDVLRTHTVSFQKTLKIKYNHQHTLPESLKRFKQVLKDFEKDGYASLISGKHGNNNSRKVTDITIGLLESMFAKDTTKPTATEVYRRYEGFISGNLEIINNESGEIYDTSEFKSLSKTTVTNYLSDWQSKIGTHALRSGDRQKYMQSFKTHHSLNQPNFAGSLYSIDDRQSPFPMHDGKRVWFYNGIDLGSEAFTCWVYGKTKEGIIINFYRQLIRNYAEWGFCLPAELEAEMSLNSSFTNTFLQEGVMFDHVRIEANNARGKRIEAYYRQLRYQLEKKREGWLARPFALSESNQAGPKDVKGMYYDDIVNGCLTDIETWNNMPHSVHTHLSRWEVFTQMHFIPQIREYGIIVYRF